MVTWEVVIDSLIASKEVWFYLGGFLTIYALYQLVIGYYHRSRLKKSGIDEIDQMKGETFEDYLKLLFESQGYKVLLTPKTGDYGADLILKKERQKIVVQAKRYKKNVGIKAVQEVTGAKEYYHATAAWVVTNQGYTQPAIKLAKANRVVLMSREQLIDQMIVFNKQEKFMTDIK